MRPRRWIANRALAVVALALLAPVVQGRAGDDAPPSERVTRYDLATREDLLFSYMVSSLVKGDVAEWPILKGLSNQVGGWITQFVDAKNIANVITTAMPMEGQPLPRLDKLVDECARTLDVDTPVVYVRNSSLTTAYVVRAFGRNHLVLTSELLKLFEGHPEELKFVVGHELGHVKCEHLDLKRKSFGLLAAMQAVDAATVPDQFQSVLPTLGLGRLLTWCRESEISADRAGLLCCGEPKVAYESMMRLLHGLNPDSTWIDPEKPGFDHEAVIKKFQDWQYRPFVKFILYVKRH